MRPSLIILCLFSFFLAQAQISTWITGDPADVNTITQTGTCLMGGAGENDAAMAWLMQRAGGGDVVVLRATGSDGYNDYIYYDLGLSVNSVETILIPNAAAAADPYIVTQIENAEAIWIAGGDQFDYLSMWQDGPIEDALNNHINVKKAPIGGISAGMAIQGREYFSAENGTISSTEALTDPFDNNLTLGHNDFLQNPQLVRTITDTHYDNPDRRGRHVAFLARLSADYNMRARGIGAEEFAAVCIDENGRAAVYGDYPTYDDFAYFLQVSCEEEFLPETLSAGSPLTWDLDGEAVKVYIVPATPDGSNWFDIAAWDNGNGGNWEDWHVLSGAIQTTPGIAPDCESTTGLPGRPFKGVTVFPNPALEKVYIESDTQVMSFALYRLNGEKIQQSGSREMDIRLIEAGMYVVHVRTEKTDYRQLLTISR